MTKEELEKEAEEYTENPKSAWKQGMTCVGSVRQAFKDGAEYGYNLAHEEMDYLNKHWGNGKDKANEWHDLRKDPNDLPKENMKQVMVITNYNECLMGWYCIHEETWYSSSCPDTACDNGKKGPPARL